MVNGRNLDYYRYDGRPIRGSAADLIKCMASIKAEVVYKAILEAFGVKDAPATVGS